MNRNQQKKGKKALNRSSNSNSQLALRIVPHPPMIRGVELQHKVTLRMIALQTIAQDIQYRNLLDIMLVAISTTAGVDLFETVRINRVRIWGPPNNLASAPGTPSSIRLEFSGTVAGATGDQQLYTDTSMGVEPAFIDARPSPKSLASNFQISAAITAFSINCPLGTVVDLGLVLRSQFGNTNAACSSALVAATAGSQYLRGMDGLPIATSLWRPEFVAIQI
jgi:hypothetical protein